MEQMICKCGARCSVVSGQRWDAENRRYCTAYQVACYRCGRGGPVCGDREAAVEAWKKEQDDDQMS